MLKLGCLMRAKRHREHCTIFSIQPVDFNALNILKLLRRCALSARFEA
jgi:hypothetical protein